MYTHTQPTVKPYCKKQEYDWYALLKIKMAEYLQWTY